MSSLRESIAKFMWRDGYEEDGVNTDKLWEGLPDRFKTAWLDSANELLALLREHGLVELDENQDFDAPLVDLWLERMDKAGEDADKVITERDGLEKFGKLKRTQARYAEMSTAFSFCERTMLKAGFRRIKEIA